MSNLQIKKSAKRDNWIKNAGGDAGLAFLDSVVDNLAKEANDKMLEKETNEVKVTEVTETIGELAAETETETVVDNTAEKAVEDSESVDTPQYVTLKEFDEFAATTLQDVVQPLITKINEQSAKIATLEKAIADLSAKANPIVNETEIPVASVAAQYKQKALAMLNDFGTFGESAVVKEGDELLKKAPVVKVDAEPAPRHVLEGLFSGT